MIFVSHTHKDKPLVEQVATNLARAYGNENVFYDSWSIQPGDGIIDEMNKALGQCKIFLFFVSPNSLASNMVSLEWQNAIIKATRGEAKLIPVRISDCQMPALMLQQLYIDLYTIGLEAALRQIHDVVQNKNTFQQQGQEFSNLIAKTNPAADNLQIEIIAKHFMEPNCRFLVLHHNASNDINISAQANMYNSGDAGEITLNDGTKCHAFMIGVSNALSPNFPFRINIKKTGEQPIRFVGILHPKAEDSWASVPISS